MARGMAFGALLASAFSTDIPIATFDGASGTTLQWEPVNDPVMGGKSTSAFRVDSASKLGVWDGEVAIVPFLRAPGFCNLQSPGLYKTAQFPDVSSADGVVVRAKESNASGLKHFNVMLTTSGAKQFMKQGVYSAGFTATGEMADHFVPWSAFTCSWRGQNASWCPELTTQLGKIVDIGLGTFYPGSPGRFALQLESLGARSLKQDLHAEGHAIDLATFDGKAPHKWTAENDPVMGGKSSSAFVVKNDYGDYSGTCRIVPSLKAPGFTIALTSSPLFSRFPDASSADGLIWGLRNVGGNISDFKVAFCDSRISIRCQFQSYKADITIPKQEGVTDVFVPWSKFSNKWSASTGAKTADSPPTAASLKSITQLQLWTEGVLGDFHLELHYVRAGSPTATFVV